MHFILLPFLAAALLVPATGEAQSLDPAALTGRWSGSGTFFSADMQRKASSLAFILDVKADGSGTGRIGDAAFQIVRVNPARDRIELRARLTGSLGTDPALAKNHLVLVITAVDDRRMEAEFHLKSNFLFDPRMRDGHVVLTRRPSGG